ncbi:MAG: hypothetical protein JWR48_5260, partial [Mycobacterium sp.]|nr:hypothetical protein [Mycobacterium sp.]
MTDDTSLDAITAAAGGLLGNPAADAINRGEFAVRQRRDRGLDRLVGGGEPVSHPAKVGMLDPVDSHSFTRDLVCYWRLVSDLDKPSHRRDLRGPKIREFGHPAEWASDTAAEIVAGFVHMHNAVADACGDSRPTGGTERNQLQAAVTYLHAKRDLLPKVLDVNLLRILIDLHKELS